MKLIKLSPLFSLILLSALCFGKTQQFTVDTLKLIEKVYLHTDRKAYYPGDYVWFKAHPELMHPKGCFPITAGTSMWN